MYRNLINEMVKKEVSVDAVADCLEITPGEFLEKVNCLVTTCPGLDGKKNVFLFDEAETIQKNFFPNLTIEYLFEREEENEGSTDNSLKKLVHDLDFDLGAININKDTLTDICTEIGFLREDMDNVGESAEFIHYREAHHKVRMLDDLIHYLVEDLNKNYVSTNKIKDDLFQKVVKNNEQ